MHIQIFAHRQIDAKTAFKASTIPSLIQRVIADYPEKLQRKDTAWKFETFKTIIII